MTVEVALAQEYSSVYSWTVIGEIMILVTCLTKNFQRLRATLPSNDETSNPHKRLKFLYLALLLAAGILRALSLVLILRKPSEIQLYFVYTLPTLLCLSSMSIFTGFIGGLYLQLVKVSPNHLYLIARWIGPSLALLYVLLFIDSIIVDDNDLLLENVLKVWFLMYILIIAGNIFFGFQLYYKFQEEQWILPLIKEFKSLVLITSLFLTYRVIYFFLIGFDFFDLRLNMALLFDIFFGEILPYAYLITTRLQLSAEKNNQDLDNEMTIEMKDLKKGTTEPLLNKNNNQ